MLILMVIVLWLASGWGPMGFVYAYFQRAFPLSADERRSEDSFRAVSMLILGPIGWIYCILTYFMEMAGGPIWSRSWLLPWTRPKPLKVNVTWL